MLVEQRDLDQEGADDSGVGLEKTAIAQEPPRSARTSVEPFSRANGDPDPSMKDPTVDDRPDERSLIQTHRRKRGDTIRASDYARSSMQYESASVAGPSNARAEIKKTVAAPGTRRTRSGTVTLAKPQINVRARVARRAANLPTIKMKIDDEPLPPQGSDEEDDELLLKRGVCWQDD